MSDKCCFLFSLLTFFSSRFCKDWAVEIETASSESVQEGAELYSSLTANKNEIKIHELIKLIN